jgi:hypothetical protein
LVIRLVQGGSGALLVGDVVDVIPLHDAAFPLKSPSAIRDLKLLFWRQREKRDAEVKNEMLSGRVGSQIE